jgi:hypothetical protein
MLWTPRRVARPPSLMLPFGTPGTEPIGYHSRIAGAPTITRAGVRYHRADASFVSVAENKHACERDTATGPRYVSVYGAATRTSLPWSTQTYGDYTTVGEGGASPLAGFNWHTITETTHTQAHQSLILGAAADSGIAVPAGQYASMVLLVSPGAGGAASRLMAGLRLTTGGATAAGVVFDKATGSIVRTFDNDNDASYPEFSDAIVESIGGGAWLVRVIAKNDSAAERIYYGDIAGEDPADPWDGTGTSIYAGNADAVLCSISDVTVVVGALPYYGPPIYSESAPTTKAAEVISWPVADFGIPGSVECHVRTYDTVPTDKRIWSWYDADGDGAIELFMDSAGHIHLRVHDGTSENADIEVTTAANDGAWRRVVASWEHNYVRLRVGNTDAIDTNCALPALASLDTSRIGASKAGQYLDGDVAEFRAHKRRII